MGRLTGKAAIITGAARGQGEATARLFASEGARVMLTDLLEELGRQVAADIGDKACFIPLDIAREDAWPQLVDAALSRFGSIDVLVNNAAITDHHPALELTRTRLQQLLDVNLLAPFSGIQAVLPVMLEAGGGSIINISSVNALRSNACQAGYDATKWAIRGMTRSLAMEFGGRNIRINSVHPGAIRTPMLDSDGTIDGPALSRVLGIAAGRLGEPEEVARVSLFLASDEASYVNGAEIAVDGGWAAGLLLHDIDPTAQVSQG